MKDTLDQLLDEATASRRVPGIVAGVYDRAGARYEGAFGVHDLGTNQPATLDSVFQIMSMTKAIAGIAKANHPAAGWPIRLPKNRLIVAPSRGSATRSQR